MPPFLILVPDPLLPFPPPFTKYHRRQNAQVNSQALQRRPRRFRPPRTNSSPDRWLSPIIQGGKSVGTWGGDGGRIYISLGGLDAGIL